MVPIRRLLLKDLLVITALVVAVVCGMAWLSLARVVEQEAQDKARVGLVRIEADLKDYFARMEALGRSLEALWRAGTLDEDHPEDVDRFMHPILKNTPQVVSLAFWGPRGQGFLLTPEAEPGRRLHPRISTQLWARREGRVMVRWIRRGDQLLPGEEAWQPLGMDPSERPWYLNALAKGRAGWVEPYAFWPDQAPGLSYVVPLRHAGGDLRGILLLDLYLEDLMEEVWKVQPTPGTQATVVDAAGRVLILPRLPAFETPLARSKAFLSPLESLGLPLGPAFPGTAQAVHAPLALSDGARRYLGVTAPFTSLEGIQWRIGVAVPLDEVGQSARIQIRMLLLVTIATFGGVVWRAGLLARRFGDPLRQMAEAAEGLISGRAVALPATHIAELNALGEVLHAAAEAIRTRAELERQVERSQRLETVGTLAGGIAHDVNNQLLAIQGQLDLATASLPEGHPAHPRLHRAEDAIQRCAQMVKSLLAFTHHAKPQVRALDLNGVVRESAILLERLLGGRIRVVLELGEGLPAVLGEPVQLEQVLLNLAVNARDAMPEGGTLTVRTGSTDPKRVQLEVADTGEGIAEPAQAHIFEPFFTTKEVGKGTGLGLSMVFGIVSAHGGAIEVESRVGQGTTFRIQLPTTESLDTQERVRQLSPPAPVSLAGRRLLVVDDEPDLRDLLADALSLEGALVTSAADGEEGWQRYQATPFDLVLSDQRMPRCTGVELLARIRGAGGRTPFILSSGHGLEGMAALLESDPDVRLLSKPFQLKQLFALCGELLQEGPGT